jgi:hypothetical protein
VPFLLLQGPAFLLIPLTSRLLERTNPRWLLGSGMASATTSLLRDFGFTLGPAVIVAIALGQAASRFGTLLPHAILPAGQAAAAQGAAQAAGPLAVNGIEPGQPGSAAHQIAYDALGHGYSLGYVVCGAASLAAAILTAGALRGGRSDNLVRREALVEEAVEAGA